MHAGRRVSAARAAEMALQGIQFADVTDYGRLKRLAPDIDGFAPDGYVMARDGPTLKYYLRGRRVHPAHIEQGRMDDVDQYHLHEGRFIYLGKVCVQERYRGHTRPVQKRHRKRESVLESVGISCDAEWRKWMRANHPDKNPYSDPDLVARVNAARSFVAAV